jgi:hypothetical protein
MRSSSRAVTRSPQRPCNPCTATTVRVRDGRLFVTDGPFAETKEQLLGFYLIEAEDAKEAIQVAARIPSARVGSIEIRPIWDLRRHEPRAWSR